MVAQIKNQDSYVVLTFIFEKEEDMWVGVCKELGTSTFDKDLCKVEGELRDLVAQHLNTLEELGERQRFFREHGIRIHRRTAAMPLAKRVRAPLGALVGSVRMPIYTRA